MKISFNEIFRVLLYFWYHFRNFFAARIGRCSQRLNSSREKLQAVEVDFGIDPKFALVEAYSG